MSFESQYKPEELSPADIDKILKDTLKNATSGDRTEQMAYLMGVMQQFKKGNGAYKITKQQV
ncbi:MAG: hypothetical protein M3Q64_03500, partial [bacterium]|nr:hypothetical protein [bacterium]